MPPVINQNQQQTSHPADGEWDGVKAATVSPRLSIYSDVELESLPDPEWLIRDLFTADSLAVLYGNTGVGKSFVGLDMAFSIATGVGFHGHEVRQGSVAYIYAEGVSGLKHRVRAWKDARSFAAGEQCGVWFIPTAVDLVSSDLGVSELILTIQSAVPHPIVLVVIDTLARCFGDEDENTTQAMNRFTNRCDVMRNLFGCTVLVIHHTGWENTKRERGNKSLRNNFDTVVECRQRGKSTRAITLACRKQKDSGDFDPVDLQLSVVTVGEASSCVVQTVGEPKQLAAELEEKVLLQLAALAGFGASGAVHTDWIDECERRGSSKASFNRHLKVLKERGLVDEPVNDAGGSTRGLPYLLSLKGEGVLRSSGMLIPSEESVHTAPVSAAVESHQQLHNSHHDTLGLTMVSNGLRSPGEDLVSQGGAYGAPPETEHPDGSGAVP